MKPVSILFKILSGTLMIVAVSAMADDQDQARPGPSPEMKAAFQSCFAEIGIDVSEGKRPDLSDDQQAQLASCLDAKGLKRPPRGEGRGHHADFAKMKACVAELGVAMPEHIKGQRPEFNEEQKAAFETCREKLKSEQEQVGSVDGATRNTGADSASAE